MSFIVIALKSPEGSFKASLNDSDTFNLGLITGEIIGAFITPIIIVGIFQAFKRFRNSISQNNIFIWTLLVLCFSTAGRFSSAEEQGLQSWLERESRATNQSLPIMIDKSTKFETTRISKGFFERYYTIIDIEEIELEKKELGELENNLKNMILDQFCSNEAFSDLRRGGVKLADIYNDKNGKLLMHIVSDPSNCASKE